MMEPDPSGEGWQRRRRYSDRAAILAAAAVLIGTISTAVTLADEWPRGGDRTAFCFWLLVLPVMLWIGCWMGFVSRDIGFSTLVLVLACAAAGAGFFLRPGEFLLLSLGEFGLTCLVAGVSLFLRRCGLRRQERRFGEDWLEHSLAEEFRWARRFREARRTALFWRAPCAEESREVSAHPVIGRFADDIVALANRDGRRWIVMERDRHGWPHPKRYVLFVLEGEAVWLARDFNRWPSVWGTPSA